MSTQVLSTCVPGNTSFADFKSWAQAISAWMATIGWTQTNDTGQVVWTATVLTCTQVAMSGTTAVISYSSYTGPAPRQGMSFAFSGFSNSGNNTSLTTTAVSGGSSGTVTATNASGVSETHAGSGTTTALSASPATSTITAYELWQATDSLSSTTPMIVKFEYGTSATANAYQFAFTAATGSNGSGTLTGNVSTRFLSSSNLAGTTGVGNNSVFSGSTGRFAIAMFINATSGSNGFFVGVERSHNSSGADTSNYFMAVSLQNVSGTRSPFQQIIQNPSLGGALTNETAFITALTTLSSGIAGTNVALGPLFPVIGLLDNPCMMLAFSRGGDIVEGTTVTVPYFGSNHTMYCTKAATWITSLPTGSATGNGLLIRFE